MKDGYKIGEISKLYGLSVDSLRYYEEIGVLKPERDPNGYRIYRLKDIYRLNIIRDLRQLDFSMPQIKDYLDHQSVDNTLELLFTEQSMIKKQIEKLQTTQKMIEGRINVLTEAKKIPVNVISIKTFPARPCLKLSTHITRDEEMDFAIKRLHQKYEHLIPDFGNQLYGASISIEDLNQGIKDVFHSVFFILDAAQDEGECFIPAGKYLSLYYRGDYKQSSDRMLEVLSFAKQHGYSIVGDPFEIYEIDNRDTIQKEEFLTEIQVQIQD